MDRAYERVRAVSKQGKLWENRRQKCGDEKRWPWLQAESRQDARKDRANGMMVNQCKSTRLKLKERKEWDHGEKGSIPQVKTMCSWTLRKRRERVGQERCMKPHWPSISQRQRKMPDSGNSETNKQEKCQRIKPNNSKKTSYLNLLHSNCWISKIQNLWRELEEQGHIKNKLRQTTEFSSKVMHVRG